MPVYEIYKVGEDLHWKGGLDFFSHFGLDLIITPHWNNNDGGDDLDTSRCYMGRERYERLLAMLPELPVILGIEENTGVVIDPPSRSCDVVGAGEAVIVRDGEEARFTAGTSFRIDSLGEWRLMRGKADIPDEVWARAMRVHKSAAAGESTVPAHVKQMVAEREVARSERNWLAADQLRNQLLEMGWQVEDTPDGPQLVRLGEQ